MMILIPFVTKAKKKHIDPNLQGTDQDAKNLDSEAVNTNVASSMKKSKKRKSQKNEKDTHVDESMQPAKPKHNDISEIPNSNQNKQENTMNQGDDQEGGEIKSSELIETSNVDWIQRSKIGQSLKAGVSVQADTEQPLKNIDTSKNPLN